LNPAGRQTSGLFIVSIQHTFKAKASYKDLLTLWEDADPDIPILKQAKAEYARLQLMKPWLALRDRANGDPSAREAKRAQSG
jgi:hypothetical protein